MWVILALVGEAAVESVKYRTDYTNIVRVLAGWVELHSLLLHEVGIPFAKIF